MSIIETRTLILSTAIAWLVVAGVLTYVVRRQRTHPGFGLFALYSATVGSGLLLLGLREIASDWISVVVGNGLLAAGGLIALFAVREFTGRRADAKRFVAVWVAYMAWVLWFTEAAPSFRARALAFSLLLAGTTALAARELLSSRTIRYRSSAVFTGAVMAVSAAWMGVRALATLVAVGPDVGILARSPAALTMWALALAVGVLGAFGMVMMNQQRIERDLESASDELRAALDALMASAAQVKVLEGLLPICSSCKRIRGEDGTWARLEKYIQEHSRASFTHGICPECAARLYPGMLPDPGE